MIGERLSMRRTKKELKKLEGSSIDEEILAGLTPEGRSLAVRVIQDMAIRGLAIQISNGRLRNPSR